MGMDLNGKQPTGDVGKYFRNNVWFWHPLWDYCRKVSRSTTKKVKRGHENVGDGLDAADCFILSADLAREIERGGTREHEERHAAEMRAIPPETCSVCDGTGVRTDELGREVGMPDMVIGPEETKYKLGERVTPEHPRYGQRGWCNGCNGAGSSPSTKSRYQFSVENVAAFIEFLRACGGFEIR